MLRMRTQAIRGRRASTPCRVFAKGPGCRATRGAVRTTRIESGSLGKGHSAVEPGNAGDGKGNGRDT
eukprot:15433541-Alexandrium_andersonii.AAC.1